VSDDSSTEKAKELLVYGPVGLALFLRDSAPQFLKMFVARGRNEVEQRRKAVGAQIDQVRSLGENAATDGGPEMLRLLSTGIATLREKAEEALTALGVNTDESQESGRDDAELADAPSEPIEAVGWTADAPHSSAVTADVGSLAIPGYDDLSASQVVDRLDGLAAADLQAIRGYETANRARNTILAKIEQLTRGT